LPGDALSDDRYLRVEGLDGPLYRLITDMSQVTPQELAATDAALWRMDQVGVSPDGPVVTGTLVGHDDTWWMSAITGSEHHRRVQKQSVDPAGLDYAHFILHLQGNVGGKPSFLIESVYFPGEFFENEGHMLTANGVKLGGAAASFVLY